MPGAPSSRQVDRHLFNAKPFNEVPAVKKPMEFLNHGWVLFIIFGYALVPTPGAAQGNLVINVTTTFSGPGGPFWGGGNCNSSSYNLAGNFTVAGATTLATAIANGAEGSGSVTGTLTCNGSTSQISSAAVIELTNDGVNDIRLVVGQFNGAVTFENATNVVVDMIYGSYQPSANATSFNSTSTPYNPGDTASITITVAQGGGTTPLTITTTSYPTAYAGQPYTPFQFKATGGNQQYSWFWSGNTPQGCR